MTKQILMAVDDNAQDMAVLQRELHKRYGEDYDIICQQTPEAALQQLEALQALDAQVLILLAARDMVSMTGIEFLAQAHERHPYAKRVLLIPWGNRSESRPILREIDLAPVEWTVRKGRVHSNRSEERWQENGHTHGLLSYKRWS